VGPSRLAPNVRGREGFAAQVRGKDQDESAHSLAQEAFCGITGAPRSPRFGDIEGSGSRRDFLTLGPFSYGYGADRCWPRARGIRVRFGPVSYCGAGTLRAVLVIKRANSNRPDVTEIATSAQDYRRPVKRCGPHVAESLERTLRGEEAEQW